MRTIKNIQGVPEFDLIEIHTKKSDYAVCIPVINESERIVKELNLGFENKIHGLCDIIICDGGSTDGSTDINQLKKLGVNSLIVKIGKGKQGAQLRAGFYFCIQRGYKAIITIDGNNKDLLSEVPRFIKKINEGYDYVQGSRFIKGGIEKNTPISRLLAVRLIHAPIISITARAKITDSTNNFRAYSIKYLTDTRLNIFRDIFDSYELLAYLSVKATQLGYKFCEIPVSRVYPKGQIIPTKISKLRGNYTLVEILIKNLFGFYNP
jgi:dolichol-phosphate mannosyltransferase